MHLLSIGELSRRSGVTVRALRYYESKGLLAPKRSEARQRLYAYGDVVRLQQIQILKRAGFTIAEIITMLGERELDARQVMAAQKDMLEQQLEALTHTVSVVGDALKALDAGAPSDLSTLCNIINMGESAMSEEKWQKVWDEFYSPEEQQRWKAAKEAIPEEVQRKCEREWPALIARTEALVGSDPASEAAQAVLKEWNAMTQMIYDVDPSLTNSAARMYDGMDDWPEDGPQAPFSKEVWAFIKEAEAVSKKAP